MTVDGKKFLELDFPVSGTLLFTDTKGIAGEPGALVKADYKKKISLNLEQTGDPAQPWLIDGWGADFTYGDIVPDPQG